jgi:hypothetical protein
MEALGIERDFGDGMFEVVEAILETLKLQFLVALNHET